MATIMRNKIESIKISIENSLQSAGIVEKPILLAQISLCNELLNEDSEKINLPEFISSWKGANECISPYKEIHSEKLQDMLELLPHGSGIDSGIEFQPKESTYTKLVFSFGYHHLNNNGYYDGWSYHKLIITPTFGSFDMNITGKNRNDIKDYLYELFNDCFTC